MIFRKIKTINGYLDKLRFWLYPEKQYELIDLQFSTIMKGDISHNSQWSRSNPLDIADNGNYDRIKVIREEAFDQLKNNHPEIFEWILFHLELF